MDSNRPQTSVGFGLIKPHAKELLPSLVQRLQGEGLHVIDCSLVDVTREMAEAHYAEHREAEFFPRTVAALAGQQVYRLVLAYNRSDMSAAKKLRTLLGPTNPKLAEPKDIRYLARDEEHMHNNVMHGSDDDAEVVSEEMELWYGPFGESSAYEVFMARAIRFFEQQRQCDE
ncbi:MAG TPA: nucleoside-diphosphate kinase [Verrucomicrobiae bacterium]|nr:nucleoside-diphosphate kinase [Verrucomicrobiae bacterium]